MATVRTRLNAILWYLAEQKVNPAIGTELKNIIEAPFGAGFTAPVTAIGDIDTSNNAHILQAGATGFGPPASVQVPNPRVGPPQPDAISNRVPSRGQAGRFV